jgi:hypothetical protein
MKYKFYYRRGFPWWRTHVVIGHRYESNQDKMVLYFEGGSLQEIKDWKSCELKLGVDWVLASQKMIERETGQEIKVNPS